MSTLLNRIMGKDDKFFVLLEAAAEETRNSAELLARIHMEIGKPAFEKTFDEITASRRKDKKIGNSIAQELCQTFVTPIEREDIEALSNKLYRIPKVVEKIAERISICPANFTTDIVAKQTRMLVQSTEILAEIVKCLRKLGEVEKIQDLYDRLQTIEGDADKLMIGLLKDLYQGNVDAKEVIILKDIYELLEAAIDLCRDAGKVVFQTALKYA
jgi:uncharacterized protein Yka (UPF0111/DUF47 family)